MARASKPLSSQPLQYHDFTDSELASAGMAYAAWPRARAPRTFRKWWSIRRALGLRIDTLHGRPQRSVSTSRLLSLLKCEHNLLSREEVDFWFALCVAPSYLIAPYNDPSYDRARLLAALETYAVTHGTPQQYFDAVLAQRQRSAFGHSPGIIARLLREVAPYMDVLEFMRDHLSADEFVTWFRFLGPPSASDHDATKTLLHDVFAQAPNLMLSRSFELYTMFATVPCDPAVEALVKAQIEQHTMWTSDAICMVMMMDDQERALDLLGQIKRAPRACPEPKEVRLFFFCFGFDRLDLLLGKVLFRARKSAGFGDVLDEVFRMKTPVVVNALYSYWQVSGLRPRIERYIKSAERYAYEGLLRACHGRGGRREWALGLLREMFDAHPEHIGSVASLVKAHPPSVQELFETHFGSSSSVAHESISAGLPYAAWMRELAQVEWPQHEEPTWLHVHTLPMLQDLDGNPLPVTIVSGLFALYKWAYHRPPETLSEVATELIADASSWLKRFTSATYQASTLHRSSTQRERYRPRAEALLEQVHEHTDAGHYEHVVLESFTRWVASSAVWDADWMVEALATAKSPATASALDHYIRKPRDREAWRLHKEALTKAIHLLYEMDTPESHAYLLSYTSEDFSGWAKSIALTFIQEYCDMHHLSMDEYEDLAVPRFGLDRGGERVFDFGPRQLRLKVKGGHEIVYVDDEEKRTFSKFPPVRKSDDREMYERAREQYMHISDALRNVFIVQNERMELAMLTGRTWKSKRWREFIGEHPILAHIARRLVWKVLDSTGVCVHVVLPDAGGAFMDSDLEAVEVTDDQMLALVHPAELDVAEVQAWAACLGEFEIIQPFVQIDRSTYRKDRMRAALDEAPRTLQTSKVVALLKKGWRCELFTQRSSLLTFARAGEEHAIQLVCTGRIDGTRGMSKNARMFYRELRWGESTAHSLRPKRFDVSVLLDISPVAFSEAMYLLEQCDASGS